MPNHKDWGPWNVVNSAVHAFFGCRRFLVHPSARFYSDIHPNAKSESRRIFSLVGKVVRRERVIWWAFVRSKRVYFDWLAANILLRKRTLLYPLLDHLHELILFSIAFRENGIFRADIRDSISDFKASIFRLNCLGHVDWENPQRCTTLARENAFVRNSAEMMPKFKQTDIHLTIDDDRRWIAQEICINCERFLYLWASLSILAN